MSEKTKVTMKLSQQQGVTITVSKTARFFVLLSFTSSDMITENIELTDQECKILAATLRHLGKGV